MVRVLHVLYKLDRGGTETWLMHVLRNIDRDQFQVDVLVHDPGPGANDAEAERLGTRIHYIPRSNEPWLYARRFRKLIKEFGPYEIVHSHLSWAGLQLYLAARAGVPVRIAHNHSNVSKRWSKLSFREKILMKVSDCLISRFATAGFAFSREAAAGRFGPDWESDSRWQIIPCGIDLEPFRENVNPKEVRSELGIPPGIQVIGHVGRFVSTKNHAFIVKIFQEINQQAPDFRLLLIGDGPLRSHIAGLVDEAGIKEKVLFTGMRDDVPRLMAGAMDVFLFPSEFESLGIVVIEAQAAGTPCIVSDTVPQECQVVNSLCQRLSLKDPLSKWVDAIFSLIKIKYSGKKSDILKIFDESRYNIEVSCKILSENYKKLLSASGDRSVSN